MSAEREYPLFTSRYGIDTLHPDAELWQRRHKAARADANATPLSWCQCPGSSLSETPCALRMTQEDALCDECRHWCVAVDRAGKYHRLIDLRGPVTP